MTTTRNAAEHRIDGLTFAGTCLVELGSAVVTVYVLGPTYEPLGMHPLTAWMFYALALAVHLCVVLTAWFGAREIAADRRLLERRRLKFLTAIVMTMSAVATLNRAGVHPAGVLYVCVVCGLGPLLMLITFVPKHQKGGHAQADR